MSQSIASKFLACATTGVAALAIGLSLPSCGGGGGDGTPTVRPKTLDELVIVIDGQRFAFNRTIGTPAAISNGDIEVGTFLYTASSGDAGNLVFNYESVDSELADADVSWPTEIQTVGYQYIPNTNLSGTLILEGFDVNASQAGPVNVFGQSQFDIDNELTIELVFTTNGSTINLGQTVIRSLNGGQLGPEGYVVNTASIETSNSTPVPENYNPEIDENRPSKIVPESLDGDLFRGNNDTDDANDFFILFGATGTRQTPSDPADEWGLGSLVVDGGAAIIDGLSYEWTRIDGTDTATLRIFGVQAPNTFMNGTYLVTFLGNDNGTYDGGAPERTGTFLYLENGALPPP